MENREHFAKERARSFFEWGIVALIVAVCFIISVDVYDNTILKSTALLVIGGCLVAFWLSRMLYLHSVRIRILPFHVPLFLFVLASFLSLFQSHNVELSFVSLLNVCFIVCTALFISQLVTNNTTQQRFFNVLLLVAASSVVAAIVVEWFSGKAITIIADYSRQLISTFGNSTYFAGFLVLIIPFVFGQILAESSFTQKKISLILLLCALSLLLIFTKTLSAMFAAGISIIVFSFLSYSDNKRTWKFFAGGILLSGILVVIFFDTIAEKIMAVFTPTSSLMRRFVFYDGAWKSFLASPLLGNGFGAFEVFFPQFRSSDYWISKSEDVVAHTHNEFLEILSESGLVGFAAFLFIMVTLVRFSKTTLPFLNKHERFSFVGILTGIVASLVDNLGNMSLRVLPVLLIFWVFVALLFSFHFQHRRKHVAENIVQRALPPLCKHLAFLPFLAYGIMLLVFLPRELHRFRAEQLFVKGFKHDIANNIRDAYRYYSAGQKEFPSHPLLLFNTAGTAAQLQYYDTALSMTQQLLQRYPFYPKAHLIHGIALYNSHRSREGIQELQAEIALRSHPQTIYLLAQMHREQRDSLNEARALLQLVQRAPNNGSNEYLSDAITRLMELNISSILPAIPRKQLFETFSSDSLTLQSLARCSEHVNDFSLALRCYERLLSYYPNDVTFFNSVRSLQERMITQ
jgi:O-antigen ligase/tetratricopeptide (TPR) repeat protein